MQMQNVKTLIEKFGGLAKLRKNSEQGGDYIRIENQPFMRLVIEWIGPGAADNSEQISVAHYYEQNGDLMRDPEITFEVNRETFEMIPLTFQQDNMGIYWELTTPAKRADAEEFCRMWDENIRDQGFVEAYEIQVDKSLRVRTTNLCMVGRSMPSQVNWSLMAAMM